MKRAWSSNWTRTNEKEQMSENSPAKATRQHRMKHRMLKLGSWYPPSSYLYQRLEPQRPVNGGHLLPLPESVSPALSHDDLWHCHSDTCHSDYFENTKQLLGCFDKKKRSPLYWLCGFRLTRGQNTGNATEELGNFQPVPWDPSQFILGPVLRMIFSYDITSLLNCCQCRFYADCTALYWSWVTGEGKCLWMQLTT